MDVGKVFGGKEISVTMMSSKRPRMSPKPLPRKLTLKQVSRDTFGEAICQLRKQLESLFAQDQAVFKQFHEIERTISDLKRQKVEISEDESSEECTEQEELNEEEEEEEVVEEEVERKEESVESSQTESSECEAPLCPKVRKPLLAFEGRFIRRDSFGTFHKHVVTFPPSRARCPRLTVVRHREEVPRRPASIDCSMSASCKDLKMDKMDKIRGSFCNSSTCLSPLPPLYRSTSVTVLPRGILVLFAH